MSLAALPTLASRKELVVTGMAAKTLHIPLATVDAGFDADAPDYRAGNPATYAVFAFCYDTLAAPGVTTVGGIAQADYKTMQLRLASRVEASADCRTWSVSLRPGIHSQTGVTLTSEDLKWSLHRALELSTMGAWRLRELGGLPSSEDITVVDRQTVRVSLRSPNPFLSSFLFSGAPLLLDSHTAGLNRLGDDWATSWLRSGATAGFGGYQLVARTGHQLRLAARPNAEDSEIFDGVIAEQVSSRAEGLAYLRGAFPAYVPGVRCDEAVRLRADGVPLLISRGGHTSLEINYNRPPFDDQRVRQALCYATPYQDILDRGLLGLALPWHGPLPSYDAWHSRSRWPYETDPATARELIKQAGYQDGIEAPMYLPDRPDATRIGEILQEAYAAIGVTITLCRIGELPAGYIPPLYIRLECGHNFNEPVYDLAHDYVPINGLVPGTQAKDGIGTWFPRYPGSRAYETAFRGILEASSVADRRRRCLGLQRRIVRSAPSVFLAENLQISAFTEPAARWATDYSRRAVQAFQFQNCNTGYLPER